MFVIDSDLEAFLLGGVACQVATADLEGRPQAGFAWGPRVNADRTLTVFLETKRAARRLANLALNPKMAVIFADPITYRSVQLKGAWLSTSGATEEDHAWVKRHRELFASNVVLVGEGPEAIRNTYMSDIIRIDMRVDAAFDQTPGPEAGKPL